MHAPSLKGSLGMHRGWREPFTFQVRQTCMLRHLRERSGMAGRAQRSIPMHIRSKTLLASLPIAADLVLNHQETLQALDEAQPVDETIANLASRQFGIRTFDELGASDRGLGQAVFQSDAPAVFVAHHLITAKTVGVYYANDTLKLA
jgi:hypothetical protein